MISEMIKIGKVVYSRGYVVSTGGNLSYYVRKKNYIIIKKSGKCLGNLCPEDFVSVKLGESHPEASMDLHIHAAIYANSAYNATLHAHPPYAIALSYKYSKLKPIDFETKIKLKDVPILAVRHDDLPAKIVECLAKGYTCVIERGHGVYVWGFSLLECLHKLELIEHAAKLIFLSENSGY